MPKIMIEKDRVNPIDPPPVRPAEPDAADCCGEGCVRCVHDIYDESIERYQRALAAWQARHPGVDPTAGKEAGKPASSS